MLEKTVKRKLLELANELTHLSQLDKTFRFEPAIINVINYISGQFIELEHRKQYKSFTNYSSQHCGFFSKFKRYFPSDSTEREILSELMTDLAKKIIEIEITPCSEEALKDFIKNLTYQIAVFKKSFERDIPKLSIQKSLFLSQFRKPKEYIKSRKLDEFNQTNIAFNY